MEKQVREIAPAKINLALDILGKRKDGFHNIETIMQTVELADIINLKKTPSGVKIITNNSNIPQGKENLAYSAAVSMLECLNKTEGLIIELDKKIPVSAGLGGGSSDAAAVIRGIMRLYGLESFSPQILDMAAELGSDVPFLLVGGTALASGRGEKIWELPELPSLEICLVTFPFGLSAGEVYTTWKENGAKHRSRQMLTSIFGSFWEGVLENLGNDLQNGAVEKASMIGDVIEKIEQEKAGPVYVSGSGPTLIVYHNRKDFLKEILKEFPVKVIGTKTCGKDFINKC